MIIISERFSPLKLKETDLKNCVYKTSFLCLCCKISYHTRGRKKNKYCFLLYLIEYFESHLFYGWIETISCCSFLKTNLICTLGNKTQQNIFLLTLNSTKVKPEENNRVVKWLCNAMENFGMMDFFFSQDSILMTP